MVTARDLLDMLTKLIGQFLLLTVKESSGAMKIAGGDLKIGPGRKFSPAVWRCNGMAAHFTADREKAGVSLGEPGQQFLKDHRRCRFGNQARFLGLAA